MAKDPRATVACPCRSFPERCNRKVRTSRPETNTSLAANCPNIGKRGHEWRSVIRDVTDSVKSLRALRDARRDEFAERGGSRRNTPGEEAGSGGSLGERGIDSGLKTRVHAAALDVVDAHGISDRVFRLFGELGGVEAVRESILGVAPSAYTKERQGTTLTFLGMYLAQELFAVMDMEPLYSAFDGSLGPGEREVAITRDICFGIGRLAPGSRLECIGEKSRTWYEDDGTGSGGQHRVGEVVPRASQERYATMVRRTGVTKVAHLYGHEEGILEVIAPGAFAAQDIGKFFGALFRATGNMKMTDFGSPTNGPALTRLILDERFKHGARSDVIHEFRCLREMVQVLCCVLVLDTRFGTRLTNVYGRLPQLPADVVGPHLRLLTALRAIVMGGRQAADLKVVKGVVARVEEAARLCAEEAAARPSVQPETEAPRDAAPKARPPSRRKTPRPRTETPKTTAQLRASGHLPKKPEPQPRWKPPRVLAVGWASGARSLLDMIKKEQGRRVRLNLETFRRTLLQYGFSGPPEPWNGRGRGIYGPNDWPISKSMRFLAELVGHLEGALANVERPDETDTPASAAPAPAPGLSAVECRRAAQLLLDKIRKEQDRPGRTSMEKLRPMLEECGFVGPSPPWGSRVVDAPVGWPKALNMRLVTALVRYLEDVIEKVPDTEETGASTALAPPSRAQPPPPPRRALSPPPQPQAQPPAASPLGYGANFELPAPSMRSEASVSAPTLDQPFDVGCRVWLRGFLKKTHRNGQYGIIAETPQDVTADGRVHVDLGDDRTLSFRVERVEACPIFGEGAEVELCCPSGAQSENNDRRGVVVGFETSGLLKVNLVDGGSVFARSVNLRSIPRNRPRRPINTSAPTTLESPSQKAPTKKSKNDGTTVTTTNYKLLSPYSPTEEGSGVIERAGCDTASLLLGDAGGEEKRNGPSDDISLESGGAGGASPSLVDNRGAALNAALDEDGASESSVGDDRQLPGESARDHRKRMRKLKKEREKRDTYKETARYLCSVLGDRSFETVLVAVEAAQGDANAAVNNLMGDDLGA